MNGTSICVSNPGVAYVTPPAMPPLAPSTAVSAAPVPTNAKDESNRQCGQWYNVEGGDYCNLVTLKYSISLSDFVFLNPSINENSVNTYSGRPGYHTPGPTGLPCTWITLKNLCAIYTDFVPQPVVTKVTFTSTKPATTTPTSTQMAFAEDTRDDCYQYFEASQMETDISGTSFRHQCDLAAAVYGVELSELLTWNPKLGNDTEAASCSFKPGVRYCGRFYFELPPPPSEVRRYLLLLLSAYTHPRTEMAYCIRSPNAPAPVTSSKPTTVITPSSTSALGPSAPTHSGQPSNCVRWHIVVDGDNCSNLADKYFITLAQFFAWNPAVSKDCLGNFWLGSAYCIGTSDSITVSRSAAPPSPTPTAFVIPSPNQPNNAVDNCNKVAQAQEGDWCSVS
ncbi:hypothetical protein IAQ61_004212 [Plenodomus lingam]|uniref:uncharacterized protein n=1 Tax=Leptosphaeria maculans TaxID=5022 RepID=UPI00331DA202|nr:hypothetical protein IAQ61_004212 [Plenodomus lingam]